MKFATQISPLLNLCYKSIFIEGQLIKIAFFISPFTFTNNKENILLLLTCFRSWTRKSYWRRSHNIYRRNWTRSSRGSCPYPCSSGSRGSLWRTQTNFWKCYQWPSTGCSWRAAIWTDPGRMFYQCSRLHSEPWKPLLWFSIIFGSLLG